MRGWLGHADLAVAPLLLARGVQNKVLEAMAAGTPVLTTRPALTGIDAAPGRDVTLCESPNDFVNAIGELLKSPEKRDNQAEAARNLVRSDYGWGAKIACLSGLIASANTDSPAQVA
jgi:glycosyltransferase involved in cell wall biosynthesis